ncbi:MAG: hypothetical protein KDA22_11450 [Phycisphaerales bacterium]|nr:hypothetical protein [Phycisphaerales bacterium]
MNTTRLLWSGLVAALISALPAIADTKTWDGGAATANWGDDANWNPDGVPGPADDVVIDVPGRLAVTYAGITSEIASLALANELSIASGSLTVAGASSVSGTLNLNNGTLVLDGELTADGTCNWSAGTLAGAGGLTVSSLGSVSFLSGSRILQTILRNEGSAVWSAGSFNFSNGTFENIGTLLASSSVTLSAFGGAPAGSVNLFDNQGTFVKEGTGVCQFTTSSSALPFVTTGSIDVQEGVLRLSSGGAIDGSVTTAPGSSFEMTGTFDYGPLADLQIGGDLVFSSVSGAYDPDLAVDGELRLSGGSMTFGGAVSAGTLVVQTGTHTFDGSIASADIELNGGSIQGSADIVISDLGTWASTVVGGTGQFVVARGATLALASGTHSLQRNMVNHGQLNWDGGSLVFGNASFTNLGSLVASSNTTLSAFGGPPGGASNLFDNQGSFVKKGAGTCQFTTSSSALPVHHSGTLEVTAGTLRIASGGTVDAPIDATGANEVEFSGVFTFASDAIVTGDPDLFYNAVTAAVPGPVATTGLLQLSGGAVVFENTIECGAFLLTSGNHTFNGSLASGNLQFNGGSFDGTADVLVSQSGSWASTVMGGTGVFTVLASGELDLGAGTHALQRDLINEGLMNWTGGSIVFSNATLTNLGTIHASSTGSLSAFGGPPGGAVNLFDNQGAFLKEGSGVCQITVSSSALPIQHTGTMEVTGGTLRLASGGMLDAAINAAGAEEVEFAGTFDFTTDAVVLGDPDIFFNGATATVPAAVATVGQLRLNGGAVVFDGTVDCSILLVNSGSHVINGECSSADLQLLGGAVAGAADLVVSQSGTWTSTNLGGTGALIVDQGAVLDLPNGVHSLQRDFVNSGNVNWTGGSLVVSNATVTNAGTFLVASDQTLSAIGGSPGGAVNLFSNLGLFRKEGGGLCQVVTSSSALPFANEGLVEAAEGTLRLSSGLVNFESGTLTAGTFHIQSVFEFSDGPLTTLAAHLILDGPDASVNSPQGNDLLGSIAAVVGGGTLELRHDRTQALDGNLQNDGTVTIDKTSAVQIAADYGQGPDGTFAIVFGLDGRGGTTFGHATVGGTATLDGLVQATQADGLVPANCDQFDIVVAGSLEPAFSATDLPPVSMFPVWTVAYDRTTATLIFVDVDLNDDDLVDGSDLGLLLAAWGNGGVPEDLNCDGTVNGADLGILLGTWGAAPPR